MILQSKTFSPIVEGLSLWLRVLIQPSKLRRSPTWVWIIFLGRARVNIRRSPVPLYYVMLFISHPAIHVKPFSCSKCSQLRVVWISVLLHSSLPSNHTQDSSGACILNSLFPLFPRFSIADVPPKPHFSPASSISRLSFPRFSHPTFPRFPHFRRSPSS